MGGSELYPAMINEMVCGTAASSTYTSSAEKNEQEGRPRQGDKLRGSMSDVGEWQLDRFTRRGEASARSAGDLGLFNMSTWAHTYTFNYQ
jgi:hypothetical protein